MILQGCGFYLPACYTYRSRGQLFLIDFMATQRQPVKLFISVTFAPTSYHVIE